MNGEWRYFRSCAYMGEPGIVGDERFCLMRTGTFNIFMEYCTCNSKDGCNSSALTSPKLLIVYVATSFSLAFKFLSRAYWVSSESILRTQKCTEMWVATKLTTNRVCFVDLFLCFVATSFLVSFYCIHVSLVKFTLITIKHSIQTFRPKKTNNLNRPDKEFVCKP